MKKLVLAFVAVAAMSFASCGNKPAEAAPAVEEEIVAVAEEGDSIDAEAVVEDVVEEAEAAAEEAPAAN
ncbi:MAG: hypothetical protein IJ244_02180 [Bacteroidaceae bacterium]|nr:hypothetical protein [Bacteroidaceae bacterium]